MRAAERSNRPLSGKSAEAFAAIFDEDQLVLARDLLDFDHSAGMSKRFHGHVQKNPGQRIEQLADGMGISTRELNLPVKKLLAAKKLSTKGQKRATTYFAK